MIDSGIADDAGDASAAGGSTAEDRPGMGSCSKPEGADNVSETDPCTGLCPSGCSGIGAVAIAGVFAVCCDTRDDLPPACCICASLDDGWCITLGAGGVHAPAADMCTL